MDTYKVIVLLVIIVIGGGVGLGMWQKYQGGAQEVNPSTEVEKAEKPTVEKIDLSGLDRTGDMETEVLDSTDSGDGVTIKEIKDSLEEGSGGAVAGEKDKKENNTIETEGDEELGAEIQNQMEQQEQMKNLLKQQ